ncbi:MAG: sodium-dependent transporter [Candidatus Peregrinibacteria bacterium]|nr:sodium-dependent transporter [Candidatus Peregrinibacteria bacterium]MCB9808158.1 sodium-dependent transporter [Candidatus Peribacteria bacterium]
MNNNAQHTWKSQWFFILASVGAAAGLGNLWRFPYMVYENGGAVFVFAYIVCLFVMIIPLMMTEVALGQTHRKEFVALLGEKAGWIGRTAGWMMVLLIVLLLGYYTPVAAWGLDYLYHSFALPWAGNTEGFFYGNILQLTDSPEIFGGYSAPVIWGLAIAYLTVFFSIFQGIHSITRVIKWTVSLPMILLGILLINAMFLPGSADGFRYLLIPDWSKIGSVLVWKDAASQAFLSANVGLIITVFYACFNEQKTNIARSALFVALGNASVSFLAAFAIFGTLGYMALQQGVPITEVVASGPTLAFVAFPKALTVLPFGSKIFSFFFFLTIFTLAIDTIFAAMEVVVATLRSEFNWINAYSREKVIGVCCVLFFIWSLAFAGGNGLYRLDALDHGLWAHLFYWAVIPQIIIIGWMVPISALRERINAVSAITIGPWLDGIVKYVAPMFLLAVYISSLPKEWTEPYGGYDQAFLHTWMTAPIVGVVILSMLLATRKVQPTAPLPS